MIITPLAYWHASGVPIREQRGQHDGKEQGQAGRGLAVQEVLRHSVVRAAASILEAGFYQVQGTLKSEAKAEQPCFYLGSGNTPRRTAARFCSRLLAITRTHRTAELPYDS